MVFWFSGSAVLGHRTLLVLAAPHGDGFTSRQRPNGRAAPPAQPLLGDRGDLVDHRFASFVGGGGRLPNSSKPCWSATRWTSPKPTTLDPYSVQARYPGDLPAVSREEAEEAQRLTREVRDQVSAVLTSYLGPAEGSDTSQE